MLKSSPQFAFFDIDDTVISDKSMFSFIQLYFDTYPMPTLQEEFNREIGELIASDTCWKIANKVYYSYFKHFPIARVQEVCLAWFAEHSARFDFYHANILNILRQHQANGVGCVFVSGSFRELLQPIADDLGVEHILSINLEREGLLYTGEILPPQTIASGKADAIHGFLEHQQASSKDCFAYGDDISDVPMLEIVGQPFAISGGRRLEDYAHSMGWPVLAPH